MSARNTRGAPGQPRVPRAVREREMVDVASRAFARHGYAAVSMDDIAAQAGVTKPLVYAYFGSKEGLIAACARAAGRRLAEQVRDAGLQPDAPPDERLWRGILAVFAFVDDHRDAWQVLHPEPQAMGELLGTLIQANAPPGAAPHTPALGQLFTAATIAAVNWWLDHPEEPREMHALRLMNFAWLGFAALGEGRVWIPPTR